MRTDSKAKDVATVGLMVAIIEAAKLALSQIPNVELVSFFIIMFTLYFGRKTLYAIPAFVIIEIMIYGFNPLWVIAYCYIWLLLSVLTMILRKFKGAFSMALLSGFFGLGFGFLCSFPYLFVTTSANPTASLSSAIAWWVAGIPFDVLHGISNFVLMTVLYKPVSRVLERVAANGQRD